MDRWLHIMWLCLLASGWVSPARAQIQGVGHCGAIQTAYTNGATNDSIYYFPSGQQGSLMALPPGGTGPWDFIWQVFNSGTNSWIPLSTQNDLPSSTVTGLAPGGYRVSIFDAANNLVGGFRAWIGTYTPSNIQVNMQANCQTVQLSAVVSGGTLSSYFNPPPDPLFINAATEIQICFSGSHTWVSDLGFYLRGPASCGSPTVVLSPNPGSIGQGAVCNSGNNISNLCFSTESFNNLNICSAPTPLTGTYGSYGASPTFINWSTLYGCDAASLGWSVQIYDCIGLDVGALTDATLTFSGTNALGVSQSMTYSTPPGFSSVINDNSCSAASASIFTVPSNAATPVSMNCGYQWNADPPYPIPNPTQLNVTVASPPVETVFSYDLQCYNGQGQPLGSDFDCPGGTGNNSVTYTPQPLPVPVLSGPSTLCIGETATYTSSIPQGTWSGPNINPATGAFSAPAGNYTITFTPSQICTAPASMQVTVTPFIQETNTFDLGPVCSAGPPVPVALSGPAGPGIIPFGGGYALDPSLVPPGPLSITEQVTGACTDITNILLAEIAVPPVIQLTPMGPLCETGSPVALGASPPGGTWSGTGITNPSVGLFDPSGAGVGDWLLTYSLQGVCTVSEDLGVTIVPEPVITLGDPGLICSDGPPVQLSAQPAGGTWSGSAVSADGELTPALAGSGAQVTYSLGGTCPASAGATWPITPNPQPDLGPDLQICEGATATLTVPGNWDDVLWGNGDSTGSLTVDAQGTYTVTVSLGGCGGEDDVYVQVINLPPVELGPDLEICSGQTVQLTAPFSGNWSTGQTGNSISVSSGGTYSYIYPNSGCPVGDQVTIVEFDPPQFDLGPDVFLCPGETVTINASIPVQWSNGSFGSSVQVSSEGEVIAVATNGPCVVTDAVEVLFLDLPVADLGPDFTTCIGDPVALSAEHPYNATYLWTDGTTDPEIWLDPHAPGVVTAAVTVENACGEAGDEITVAFEDCEYAVFIPNAFTPDEDGINDVWRPEVRNLVRYEVVVADRWGRVVFRSTDPEEYWVGNFNGGAYYVQPGVYAYRLTFSTERLDARVVTGHVTVLR